MIRTKSIHGVDTFLDNDGNNAFLVLRVGTDLFREIASKHRRTRHRRRSSTIVLAIRGLLRAGEVYELQTPMVHRNVAACAINPISKRKEKDISTSGTHFHSA